jgi:hypothetical protein
MEFENIAFSKPSDRITGGGKRVVLKFLACAECNFGPIGYCEDGGSVFWVAANRVAYRS